VPAFSLTPLTEEPQEPIARGRANLREVAEQYRTTAEGTYENLNMIFF